MLESAAVASWLGSWVARAAVLFWPLRTPEREPSFHAVEWQTGLEKVSHLERDK